MAVATVVCIENGSNFAITDNLGAEIPFEYLKDIIQKYEKAEQFYLQIKLDGEYGLCQHAMSMKTVCTDFYIKSNSISILKITLSFS